MVFQTPLRYPGGKARLGPWMAWMMRHNGISGGTYIEPYAGGAGAAFYLLLNKYVRKIIINDLDPAIYSFWQSILFDTDNMINLIRKTPVTMSTWRKQKNILENKFDADRLELGFAAFFLNRTNRSGILAGGVIGGQSQDGNYKINARFNKAGLIERIRKIAKHKAHIEIHAADALDLISDISPHISRKSLIYLDPPYFNKASGLYQNFYQPGDHASVSEHVRNISTPWMVTYDNCDDILSLYSGEKTCEFSLTYSTHNERPKATELMIYRGIKLPSNPFLYRSSRPFPSTWQ